jgi:type II secretory ATPase GspE/PulE/Tfp pilus assembly ATPase PilB-like protein
MARTLEGRRVWRAHGCEHCLGGYRGRTGIHELLLATPAFQEAVRQNAPVAELQTMAQAKGMRPMVQDGLMKVINGVTSLAELLRSAGHTA